MNLELLLLILESVLLLATIILLVFSIKEGRGRSRLLLEVERATKVLTREEYFLMVTDAMVDANKEISGCITGRIPTGDDRNRVKNMINIIEKLSKNGVKIRYLLPKLTDRIHLGYLYSRGGAEVRFSGCPIVGDIRYIIIDRKLTIIGIPESIGEKEATRKGYKIPSEGLSSVLLNHFESCWHQSTPFREYVKEVIEQSGLNIQTLAREVQLDVNALKEFISE